MHTFQLALAHAHSFIHLTSNFLVSILCQAWIWRCRHYVGEWDRPKPFPCGNPRTVVDVQIFNQPIHLISTNAHTHLLAIPHMVFCKLLFFFFPLIIQYVFPYQYHRSLLFVMCGISYKLIIYLIIIISCSSNILLLQWIKHKFLQIFLYWSTLKHF